MTGACNRNPYSHPAANYMQNITKEETKEAQTQRNKGNTPL